MTAITQLGVIAVSLVGILLMAVNAVRPSRGPRSVRGISFYPEPSSATHGLVSIFCVFAFADGYSAIAPRGGVGQVGACLGIAMALMPSLEITSEILSVLAAVVTISGLTQTTAGVVTLLAQTALVLPLLTGRLIGRVFAGPARRRASRMLVVAMADIGLLNFLVSPANQSIVGSTLTRIATSTAVAFGVGIAFAMPGILIPALVGIAVSTTTLLLTATNIDGSSQRPAELTFLVCAGATYTLVRMMASRLVGHRRSAPQRAR